VASIAVLLAILAASLAAPLYANLIADSGPRDIHISETVQVGDDTVDVVGRDGQPVGPTWTRHFFLGADASGRDLMVRVLYGARNSLLIGVSAALATVMLGVALGLVAGYGGGVVDDVISWGVNVLWAFPGILLGIALGAAMTVGGLDLGPLDIPRGSVVIPVLVIALGTVPYVARPVRAEALSLRGQDFVAAARGLGMGPIAVMGRELLPNVAPTLLVLFPLIVGNAIQLEAALSFLGIGVQPPEPSWGALIDEGVPRIETAPLLALVPGALVVLTVLTLNLLGDGVRRALDPHARRQPYLKQT
jgi:peptide/nickel transport system permease protein